ncbi:hypothetical protein SEA_APPLECIDER_57 [Arthrobacter phage AppleCider]|uniref:Uncharacterized protein n=2 Tax=Korravirus wayne TaxID=1982085 RepID=A0A0U4B7S9_9CAUD|nr:hypothetical protein FDH63_gp59 [Arthrobacter phage Wayne]ALY10784.1 hypothetical protein PBI_WAYNE_60 [Arthrobacter phage Wayne]AZF97694.1 hypothetical protein SEA_CALLIEOMALLEY_58 [Arthrobacter phage CallieOMalley]QHB47226.1 hypothetical protein SEA_APPLECIDER_57 [Arthrobacter phage AppleCider]
MKEFRTDRLPKWAQGYISQLERDLDIAQRENEQLKRSQFGEPGSNTYVAHYGEEAVMLPESATVHFRLSDSDWPDEVVRVRVTKKGVLNINGSQQLVILPSASNDIQVGKI